MLKRIEVYADSALLSFPLAILVLAATAAIAMPIVRQSLGAVEPGMSGTVALAGPLAVITGVLSVWLSRMLHRKTTSTPLTQEDSRGAMWIAGGSGLVAVLLAVALWTVGSEWPVIWMSLGVLLMALAVALLVDAVTDLFRTHTHRLLDVVRLVILLPLGASLIAGLVQPAESGSDADIGPWVIGVTAYMLVVALMAFSWDEFAAWRTRAKETRGHLAAGV